MNPRNRIPKDKIWTLRELNLVFGSKDLLVLKCFVEEINEMVCDNITEVAHDINRRLNYVLDVDLIHGILWHNLIDAGFISILPKSVRHDGKILVYADESVKMFGNNLKTYLISLCRQITLLLSKQKRCMLK